MNKIRAFAPVSFAALLGGAAFVSCMSFSSGPDNGLNTAGTGGTTTGSGAGGDTSGSAGSGNPTGAAGSGNPTGAAGSGNPTGAAGSGGSTGAAGRGGSTGAAGAAGGSTGAAGAAGGSTGAGGSAAANGPCDILRTAGNTCGAAHSTVRALYAAYTGPLYQVCKGTAAPGPASCPGAVTMDIGTVAGGYANAAAQDTFCAGATCTISIIYDQSPNANHLHPSPRGGAKGSPDNPANATDLKTTLNGHAVYGIYIKPGMGYRAGCTGCAVVTPRGTATGDQAETEYMVTTQTALVDSCCFDYGNAETSSNDDGNGTMEAVYFGGGVVWGTGSPGGHNNGPWVMADLENGLYAGWQNNQDQNISTNTPLRLAYITGVVVGDVAAANSGQGRFALYGGDATSAAALKVMYDGIRPAKAGYVPMRKQGSIILGTGGDNSASGGGQWFEGVMAAGAASAATINAVQANIAAAGYGK